MAREELLQHLHNLRRTAEAVGATRCVVSIGPIEDPVSATDEARGNALVSAAWAADMKVRAAKGPDGFEVRVAVLGVL